MSRKQWFVCAELSRKIFIEYTPTKKQAEELLTQVRTITGISYIDFIWKSEIDEKPFSILHGRIPVKVNSIMDQIA